jgi:NADH-quinone oxidoreductase subunit M
MLTLLLSSPLLIIFSLLLTPKMQENRMKTTIEGISLLGAFITCLEIIKIYVKNEFNKGNSVVFELLIFPGKPVFRPGLFLDGLSLTFLILTTFTVFITVLSVISSNKFQEVPSYKGYFITIFLIEFFLIGAFLTTDTFLFYICFEGASLPMFFMIGIWGSGFRRIKASYYFFMYTFIGSLSMLIAICVISTVCPSTDVILLSRYQLLPQVQYAVWVLLFIFFAIKIPIFPFHIWLPEAHVEAPTEGSVILAALLLKLGGYGFIRFMLRICPDTIVYYSPLVYTMAILSIVYASLTAIRQVDIKRIIAYSSIAHMNMSILGIFSLNQEALSGAIFLMFGHGLVSAALFFLIGVLYKRYGTRSIYYFGGFTQVMPLFAFFFLFFSFANTGIPGTVNFVGEIIIFLGLCQSSFLIFFIAGAGFILSVIYSIWLYNRVCFGNLQTEYFPIFSDLNYKEIAVLSLLLIPTLFLGVYPNPILGFVDGAAFDTLYYGFYRGIPL